MDRDSLETEGARRFAGDGPGYWPRFRDQVFTTTELAELLGLPLRKILSFIERGYLRPSIADAHGYGSKRLYSYADFVQALLAKQLLDVGISVKKTREIISRLNIQGESTLEMPIFLVLHASGEPKSIGSQRLFLPDGSVVLEAARKGSQQLWETLVGSPALVIDMVNLFQEAEERFQRWRGNAAG